MYFECFLCYAYMILSLFFEEKLMNTKQTVQIKTYVYIALMSVLICVCSWISIPFIVPFTMQTFAVFCSLILLGGKKGTAAIGLYLFMGLVGLPVFSGFRGGVEHLIGPTGGYVIGFLLSGITYTLLEPLLSERKALRWIILSLGQIICYLIGTLWFITIYGFQDISYSFASAFSLCVLPFIIPDGIKMVLAVILCDRIKKHIDL